MTKLRDDFLTAMSRAACSVNILSTDDVAGRAGVTVSAMASVSADTPKPTLLTCVHHRSTAAQKIIDNGCFVVNLLRDDQSYISETFAGRFKGQIADKFDCAAWAPMQTGAPRVVDPLAAFDCRVISSEKVGTHHVFLGEGQQAFVCPTGSPLLYAYRAYGSTSRIEAATSVAAGRAAVGRRLSVGCFHTFGPYVLPEMLARILTEDPTAEVILVEGDQRRVQEALRAGEVEVALLYDIDLRSDLTRIHLADLHPYVLLPEANLLAAQGRIALSDLTNHPMVLMPAPPSGDYCQNILKVKNVFPRIAFRSATFEMVRGMVGHGLGFALLATRPVANLTDDDRTLAMRPLDAKISPGRMVLATPRACRSRPPPSGSPGVALTISRTMNDRAPTCTPEPNPRPRGNHGPQTLSQLQHQRHLPRAKSGQ